MADANPGVAKSGADHRTKAEATLKRLPKMLIAVTALGLFVFLMMIIFGDNGFLELSRLRAREAALARENNTIAGENVNLFRTIDRLKRDPVFIESVARNKLGMVGKEDIVVIRPDAKRQSQ
jgi:cell division protein FtsB